MSYTVELMDAAKAAQGMPSDYRLAQVLGVTRSTVSNWRVGAKFPSDTSTCEMARLAGVDPGAALLGVMLDRRGGPELSARVRSAWLASDAPADAPG